MDLTSPITHISGIGSIFANKLAKLGISSVFDLLYHLPFRFEDRSLISTISQCQVGETVTVIANVVEIKNEYTRRRKVIQRGTVSDSTATLPVIWFNQTFLSRTLTPGTRVALSGKVESFAGKTTLLSPSYEIIASDEVSPQLIHTGRLVPIYSETAGVTSKWLRSKIHSILESLPDQDFIPLQYLPKNPQLPPWKQALFDAHFPQSLELVGRARQRLAFDELLLLQLTALLRREEWQSTKLANSLVVPQEKVLALINSLPFTLTPSQNQSIRDILSDLAGKKPMNRLLQGDVGSGKTVVAAIAAFVTHLNSFQTLFLAPTQILAQQHFETLSGLLKSFGITVELVTGTKKPKFQKNSPIPVIVGTHALLTAHLNLSSVGLVVIDEQHRFGVVQRSLAASKTTGKGVPHTLTMTATPIPRTVALTLHGDLDLSLLSDMPSGRLPVKTWVVPQNRRESSYTWIKNQLTTTSSQAFWVCPFIDPSETLTTIRAATEEFERLKSVFPEFKLGLLHGKLKAKEKEDTLTRFRAGEYQILVSTPVVEVGIDIPNATLMVIEAAERFGLAQLHQLRGRVGRGAKQSYSLLFAPKVTPRLKAMEKHHSGHDLADIDFKLRGPGEIYGTAQHGVPQFRIATYDNIDLIEKARSAAEHLLTDLDAFPELRRLVKEGKIDLVQPN